MCLHDSTIQHGVNGLASWELSGSCLGAGLTFTATGRLFKQTYDHFSAFLALVKQFLSTAVSMTERGTDICYTE